MVLAEIFFLTLGEELFAESPRVKLSPKNFTLGEDSVSGIDMRSKIDHLERTQEDHYGTM
jgi:hypothetical protein